MAKPARGAARSKRILAAPEPADSAGGTPCTRHTVRVSRLLRRIAIVESSRPVEPGGKGPPPGTAPHRPAPSRPQRGPRRRCRRTMPPARSPGLPDASARNAHATARRTATVSKTRRGSGPPAAPLPPFRPVTARSRPNPNRRRSLPAKRPTDTGTRTAADGRDGHAGYRLAFRIAERKSRSPGTPCSAAKARSAGCEAAGPNG